MLGGAVLLAALVAALASFGLAYSEAKEMQDDMLRQVAVLRDLGASTTAAPTHDKGATDGDPESKIVIVLLPRDPRPAWMPEDLRPGFHTLRATTGNLRAYVRYLGSNRRIVVAQPIEVRNEIAIDSALRTLVPLLLLLPVLAWLVLRIVRNELAPVALLAQRLDAQPADRPEALPETGLPDEIAPFVQAINRLIERVNHLIGQQRRFISDAAHELRSPLTALSVQAQNLRQAGALASLPERVEALQSGIERARRLTEQLLTMARTQAGADETTLVDVAAMARELIAEFLPLAETNGIDLGMEEVASLTLRLPAEVLRLILRNGLENALKYTPRGGEVTLRLSREGETPVIEVADSGPGIASSERGQAFDAFHRLPGAPGEGSGLGLAIAREAALRLGAVLRLEGRGEGPGLLFRLVLQGPR